ncbi:MAG: hypothetical protein RL358_454 [Pseudomonadota bacterium]|jgi:excisionase family DNA binding protein
MNARDADYCSTREASESLGISLRTVQLWVESGALQAWKTPGGHRRVSRASVRLMLQERRRVALSVSESSATVLDILIVDGGVEIVRYCHQNLPAMGIPFSIRHLGSLTDAQRYMNDADVFIVAQQGLSVDDVANLQRFCEARKDFNLALIVVVDVQMLLGKEMQEICNGVTVYAHPPPLHLIRSRIQHLANSILDASN